MNCFSRTCWSLFFGVWLLGSAVAQDTTKPDNRVINETPLTIGSTFQLKSDILGSDREVNVWLPPSYAEGTQTFPVLYVIDGGVQQDFHHISGLLQLASINASIQDMIVVGIKTQDRIESFATNKRILATSSSWTRLGTRKNFMTTSQKRSFHLLKNAIALVIVEQ